ncbi:pyrimidine precursor biosynthesis enzyme THI5 [Striga asiatica]|uniref:Pyrimidine biosynthesis enzyme THI5 n=1 Tax=Striga asiatica TaxID=4170 RepID=A0A5A7R940_STRAF|nr:pyrimidine precursor biosynthesis enzyme THI5 [Striga asiatica]
MPNRKYILTANLDSKIQIKEIVLTQGRSGIGSRQRKEGNNCHDCAVKWSVDQGTAIDCLINLTLTLYNSKTGNPLNGAPCSFLAHRERGILRHSLSPSSFSDPKPSFSAPTIGDSGVFQQPPSTFSLMLMNFSSDSRSLSLSPS